MSEVVGAAVVVASGACAVVVVVGVGAALEVFVGALLGVVVTPLLAIVKFARRLDLLPSDQVSRTLMLWEPSASFVVSYGSAVPSESAPTKSKGGSISVRMGGIVRHEPSR